jgi:hypothetical protein
MAVGPQFGFDPASHVAPPGAMSFGVSDELEFWMTPRRDPSQLEAGGSHADRVLPCIPALYTDVKVICALPEPWGPHQEALY